MISFILDSPCQIDRFRFYSVNLLQLTSLTFTPCESYHTQWNRGLDQACLKGES